MNWTKEIHPTNRVHPTALIDEEAVIGENNTFGPFCYIGPNVIIGNNNSFVGHVSVGTAAEHRDYFYTHGKVVIGNDNMIREFVTINSSTFGITRIGNNCVMLRGSHLSHDSILEDGVNVSCNVLIGGESYVMKGANLGLGAIIHQRQVIGSYAMLGMGAVVTKRAVIEVGNIYVGNPSKLLGPNKIGLERAGVSLVHLNEEMQRFIELKNFQR